MTAFLPTASSWLLAEVVIPFPPVRDGWLFYGPAVLFVSYLLYIFLRKPKAERTGAPAAEREL
ncbi:hypothetical protein Isop_2744 [Isosphaera pallida ATCC 43644]|jgi:hypothetical protein|uniref:Uncharacterized protein n=1 Tax=Isosphaera pallida (strain ATCC 43644 / DSM 9630 / IS1B) TaxID=575540 RepID=E8R0H9_ISOPI|nr:hypothetical protein [Isosphaera pallida]ADV63311.1 hypothetical protein Isop_2744 [Isosphaera pallida ATCC 43644]